MDTALRKMRQCHSLAECSGNSFLVYVDLQHLNLNQTLRTVPALWMLPAKSAPRPQMEGVRDPEESLSSSQLRKR